MLVLKQNRVHMIASVIWTAEGWSMTAPALLALVISVCQNQSEKTSGKCQVGSGFLESPACSLYGLRLLDCSKIPSLSLLHEGHGSFSAVLPYKTCIFIKPTVDILRCCYAILCLDPPK